MRTDSWRFIFLLLSFLGTFAVVAIFGMLFWMTDRIDQIGRDNTQALVQVKLAEYAEGVRLAAEDMAFWTLAYDLVKARDDSGVLDSLGSSASDSALLDQLFILSPDGALLYAFDDALGAEGHSLFDMADFSDVWRALQDIDAKDYGSVGSFIDHKGEFAFVSAAWITPDWVVDMPDVPLPVLIVVNHLGDTRLDVLIRDAGVSAADLVAYTGTEGAQENSLSIPDMTGAPVAMLTWEIQSEGVAIRRELFPSVVFMGLGIFGICGFAARYFRFQHIALQQAKKIATTDQLTGLMNRAGLAEHLRRKDVLRSLEVGHLATIYLDLNKFKDLNDTFGHHAGDIALRVTAERLQLAVRKSDFVTRLGGDEFVCVVLDKNPEAAAMSVAKRILDLSAAPISFEGHEALVTPSIGLAVASPGTHWETVLSQSDAAMFWSKQKKADYPVIFCRSMDPANYQMTG